MTFPKKILLIDHDPSTTRDVREALERTGRYSIREEHDEQAALQSAHWFQPDLILLDFMTNMVAAGALARHIGSPVLCISSLQSSDEIASAGVLDGYSFFAGPLHRDELVRGVEQLLFA